jgi:hypothetical protein
MKMDLVSDPTMPARELTEVLSATAGHLEFGR